MHQDIGPQISEIKSIIEVLSNIPVLFRFKNLHFKSLNLYFILHNYSVFNLFTFCKKSNFKQKFLKQTIWSLQQQKRKFIRALRIKDGVIVLHLYITIIRRTFGDNQKHDPQLVRSLKKLYKKIPWLF